MSDTISELEQLHQTFCKLTHSDPKDLRYRLFEHDWYSFHREGFTIQELELVIRYVEKQNRKASSKDYLRKMIPSKIIGDLARFCEDLVEAKRLAAHKPTPRQQVVAEFRRQQEQPNMKNMARGVKDVLLSGLNDGTERREQSR